MEVAKPGEPTFLEAEGQGFAVWLTRAVALRDGVDVPEIPSSWKVSAATFVRRLRSDFESETGSVLDRGAEEWFGPKQIQITEAELAGASTFIYAKPTFAQTEGLEEAMPNLERYFALSRFVEENPQAVVLSWTTVRTDTH